MSLTSLRSLSRALLVPLALGGAGLAASLPAQAAHPLITDDTGTQGTGHWQCELNTDQTRVRDEDGTSTHTQAVNATLTRGITDTLDLAMNLPYQHLRTDGDDAVSGVGDITAQAKWRFHEAGNWSFALKPAVTLPSGNASKGLGTGRSTQALSLIGQYQNGPWTWLTNAGATHYDNNQGLRTGLWSASTAVLYAPSERWSLAADVGASRNPDATGPSTLSYALAGAIYHWGKNVDLDVGYRQSLQSGPIERTLGAGVTMRW